MTLALALLVGGLVLLTFSADRLVVSAVALSRKSGLSPILIGAVVVGLGTSAPELSVSVSAALDNDLGLAVGNVVGSNIANVTLVIGAAALVSPLRSQVLVLRREGVLMFLSVSLLGWFLLDQELVRWEGLTLLGGLVVALWLLVRWARGGHVDESIADPQLEELEGEERPTWFHIVAGLVSLGLTLLGAELLVSGASDLAEELGMSSTLIGLLLVAVGTSLPELATALASARRRESDLVIGNIVGSNLFNSLAVAGSAAVVGPATLDSDLLTPAVVAMVGVAAAAGLFSLTGGRVVRWEGALLLVAFATYAVLISV